MDDRETTTEVESPPVGDAADAPPSALRGTVDLVAAADPSSPDLPDHDASLLPANTPRLTSTRPQRTRRAIALALVLLGSVVGVFESGE